MTELSPVVDAIVDELIPLAGALNVRQLQGGVDRVELTMPAGGLAANHVGTVYAGAMYTLAELTGGALAALAGAPEFIPVLIGGEIQHTAPSASEVRCVAIRDHQLDGLGARWAEDRRVTSTVPVECFCGDDLVATASFTYRWLGPR